jgi:glycosyltransferase involved in cell wall biosynthesis
VYVVTEYSTANIFGYDQIRFLSKDGFKVHLVCGTGKLRSDLSNQIISTTQLSKLTRNISLLNDFVACFQLIKVFKKINPSIVIYSSPKASLLAALASCYCLIPIRIYQIWGARWQGLSRFKRSLLLNLDRLTLILSTQIIGVSRSIIDLYSSLSTKKINLIFNGSAIGIDSRIFKIKENKLIVNEGFFVGFAGRIAKDKGIVNLIVIFEALQKSYPDIKLEIIGDLDLADPIDKNTIDKIEFNKSIVWIKSAGRIELSDRMQKWNLQIFPSSREGLGNSIIEAGACGVPTICWNIVGAKDASPTWLNNLLLQNGDLNQFIDTAISYLKSPLSINQRSKLSLWTHDNFETNYVLNEFVNYIKSLEYDA